MVTGAAMSDPIDDVFGRRREAREKREQRAASEESEREARGSQAAELVDSVIHPALTRVSEGIQRNGPSSEVKLETGPSGEPGVYWSVVLTLPESQNDPELRFTYSSLAS